MLSQKHLKTMGFKPAFGSWCRQMTALQQKQEIALPLHYLAGRYVAVLRMRYSAANEKKYQNAEIFCL